MIIYITSFFYNEYIVEAIEKSQQNILNAIVTEKFNFGMYIKQQLEQLQAVNILILELSSLSDTEEEIIKALNNLRLLYNDVKIIILAPNRTPGDKLLSEIFSLGIYDILAIEQEIDGYLFKKELIKSISEGYTYKDSVKFRDVNTSKNESKQAKIIKEKIIIKNEVRQAVNKALIGFIGTQNRIGVTHNAIVSANYLKSKGYKVAIVENSLNPRKCFDIIKDSFTGIEDKSEEKFTLNHIDFYPDFKIEEVHKILSKNYNFVILDFGEFKPEYLSEFRRCVVQIIVTGSKSWELEYINNLFEISSEDELKEYVYLFNFTSLENTSLLRENMGVLDKVYFTDYTPDPFNSKFYSDLDKIFKEYLTETSEKIVKKSFVKELLEKFK